MTPAELKEARKTLELTQAQLAQRLGVHRVTLARWESDGHKPIYHQLVTRAIQGLLLINRIEKERNQ